MKIVCISDTHSMHDQIVVPDGDILIHAGDFTNRGVPNEIESFAKWIESLPHNRKVIVPGNHDLLFEDHQVAAIHMFQHCAPSADLLIDQEVTIEGLKFYGSPWQPEFFDWAFNLPRGQQLAYKWSQIPLDVDILVTHGPPYGILDVTRDGRSVGCEALAKLLATRDGPEPKIHVFGHIHEGYGIEEIEKTTFVNASICTAGYSPTNTPIVIDI